MKSPYDGPWPANCHANGGKRPGQNAQRRTANAAAPDSFSGRLSGIAPSARRSRGRPVARASSPMPNDVAGTGRTRSTGVPRFPPVGSTGFRCGTLAAPLNKALDSVARTPNPPSLFRRFRPPSTRNRSAAIIRRRLAKGRIHVADTTVPGRLPISGRHHRAPSGTASPRGHHHLRNVQRPAFGGRPEQAAFDDARLFAGHPLQFSGAGNGG